MFADLKYMRMEHWVQEAHAYCNPILINRDGQGFY